MQLRFTAQRGGLRGAFFFCPLAFSSKIWYQCCQVCGTIVNRESIPATGHTFTDWNKFVMATDATVGVEIRFCSVCGYYELRQADPTDPTEPPTEPSTEPSSEPSSEPTSEPVSEPTSEPVTEPATEPTTSEQQDDAPQGFFARIGAFFRNLFDKIFGIFRR